MVHRLNDKSNDVEIVGKHLVRGREVEIELVQPTEEDKVDIFEISFLRIDDLDYENLNYFKITVKRN